jgi:hypothetical protein
MNTPVKIRAQRILAFYEIMLALLVRVAKLNLVDRFCPTYQLFIDHLMHCPA